MKEIAPKVESAENTVPQNGGQAMRHPGKVSLVYVIGYVALMPVWLVVSEWLGSCLLGGNFEMRPTHLLQHFLLLFLGAGLIGWVIQRRFQQILNKNRILLQQKEHFRNLYQSAPAAYQALDAQGRVVKINQAWLQMLGYSEDEVIGQSFEKFLPASEHRAFHKSHADLFLSGQVEEVELQLVRKDGGRIFVFVQAGISKESENATEQSHSILLNITEAKRHAVEVERLNRLYAVLSQVNQAVVRAQSELEVFEKVCKAAFTYGGFKMVWFGQVHRPTGIIHPAAHSCGAALELRQFCFSTVHGFEKSGLIAAAIRDKRPAICNALQGETRAPFWHQLATVHGVGSAAVFPILVEGESRAIFVLFAAEADFFQAREVALLEEASSDVGFALTVLENDQRRRAMEDAIRQRQAKLDSLFRAVPAGIGVVLSRQITEANQAFCEMTGYRTEELIGKSIRMIHAVQQDHETVEREILRSNQVQMETKWRRKDGQIIDVLLHVSRISPNDLQLGVTFVALDITERIKAEVALRHSVQQLEESRRIARLGAYELDVSTGTWTASGLLDEIFGIATVAAHKRDVPGWLALVHPEDQDRVLKYFDQDVLGRRAPFDMEYRIIRPCDQQVRWVHGLGELALDAQGQVVRMVGTIQDITKQKRIEEAHRKQEARLSSIFQALPSGVGVASNRVLKEVNQRICEMSGYTVEELLGQSTRILYESEADYERAGLALYGSDQNRTIGNTECRWKRKNGEIYDVLICSSQLDSGDAMTVTFTVTDITEKKQLKEQFLRAQRIESIGTLASGVAHDLNNILAPIMLSIDMLRAGGRSKQDLEMLQMLAEGTQRGAGIVKQLLLFGRGVEGKRALLPPRPLLAEMLRVIKETFPKSIVLEQKIAADLWPVNADATQLHQVLLNLCVNARDAMPDGGRLALHAENVMLDELFTHANPDAKAGPYIALRITDTGAGIPPEVMDKIFDPFFTTKEQGKGTGLGLSTVLGILKSHEGFIQVSSQRGKGSEFKVYLPASPHNEDRDVLPAQAECAPQGNGELVLVVDDEAAIRVAAKRILEKNGYAVLTASNGAEGLVLFSQNQTIQVVITDLVMPVMDGPTLVRVLNSYTPNLRVISMSGLATHDAGTAQAAIAAGRLLHKPFTSEELLRLLDQVLQNHERPPGDPKNTIPRVSNHIECASI